MEPFNPILPLMDLFQDRLKDEYTAFYFYRAAATWCNLNGYINAAKYYDKEADAELSHAQRIIEFLRDWGCKVKMPALAVAQDFESFADTIYGQAAIEQALYVQYDMNAREAFRIDMSAFNMLCNFVEIQRSSVAESKNICDRLAQIDVNDGDAVMLFEQTMYGEPEIG